MNKFKILALGFIAIVLFLSCEKKVGKLASTSTTTTGAPPAGLVCDSVKYNAHIKPIIMANCAVPGCHVSGFSSGDFTTYAGLNAKITNGKFKARVIDANPGPMPASGQLSQSKLDSIQCWLNSGALNN
ncbi:MAG: hypothetical protein H0W73_12735 [Bacteroidetes bacterium]|nr:hypothetical protein [Bacteroidota bacterium]